MSGVVYITGLGIVSPIGVGKQAFLDGLLAGRSGLGPLRGLKAEEFRIGRGGEVDYAAVAGDGMDADGARCLGFALRACEEAISDAGLDRGSLPRETTLALGSGAGEMRAVEGSLGPAEEALSLDHQDPLQPPNSVTSKLARRLGLEGRQVTFVNACAAGAQAIAVASDLIRSGRAQVALAGGVEVLTRMVMSGFESLRAVSPTASRPFDAERDGIQLSEIAAFVLLESGERVRNRGASPYACIAGSGMSVDAFHVVRPDEQGAGAALAMKRALAGSGLSPGDIDYVNAHGTGTMQNDPAELTALVDVFAGRVPRISSTKAMLGHALGASGAAEVIICALALREQFLPPTINWRQPISGFEDIDVVPNEARTGVPLKNVLSSAFAFGGHNVVLALSATEPAKNEA